MSLNFQRTDFRHLRQAYISTLLVFVSSSEVTENVNFVQVHESALVRE